MRMNTLSLAIAGLAALTIGSSALAQKKYDIGATDKEIKIGGISPYSGPASAMAPSARRFRPTSPKSTTKAASMAARSTSSAWTTATTQPRR